MEENRSLSARVKRRNAQGFYGVGTGHIVDSVGYVHSYTTTKAESGSMGNYTNVKQNHKERDYKDAAARKSRLGYDEPTFKIDNSGNIISLPHSTKNRQLCRKYADKHQRLR